MNLYKGHVIRPYFLLKISLKILRWTGTWAPIQNGIFHYLFLLQTISIFLFKLGILFFVEIVDIIINWGDIAKISSAAPLFLTNTAYVYKFFIVNRNRKKIQDLLSIIDSPMFSNNNSRYKNIIMWYNWQNVFHNGIYQIFGIMTVLFWATIPVTALLNGDNLQLPLDGWYPYETTKKVAFIFTWAHQVMAVVTCCINNLAIDALISSFLNVATCQFEILKQNIVKVGNYIQVKKSLLSSNEKVNDNFIYDNNINGELRSCIEHNLAILQFIKDVEKIFSSAIGYQLFINCFVTCLSTFYITQNDNLSMAVYMGNWWKLKPRYKRDLHIIMLRTRRPLILSTSFLMKLSISTFVSIIQSSYSIFMVLYRKSGSK
ncbi:odorant receptor 2a-like isoform X2 [Leptopilina boulardi]|uniref:odorant receptor 2a-like isoform X2 n=1 Tax=Leptopilina boulardi TaxID=63433 RepID=UPI0021F634E2|nr:odorant receptor 2a-like isoform X2 [Leptopilina boulardi]